MNRKIVSLTLLRAVSPPGHPAAVAAAERVGGRRQAHGLHQRAQRGWPGLLQLQQCDVVVEGVWVVVLVHDDPPDVGHMSGAALRQHSEVGAPGPRV